MGQLTLKKVDVLTTSQALTATFADVGDEINTLNCKTLFIWVDTTKNSDTGVRLKVLGKLTAAGAVEYVIPGQMVDGTGVVDVLNEPYQIFTNGKALIKVDLDCGVPFVQIQAAVGTDGGGTAATINSLYAGLTEQGA